MEAFDSMLCKAVQLGLVSGIKLPNDGPVLSHLLYADDALVMGEWSNSNIKAVARILRVFHLCSGLKINFHKSNLFGVGSVECELESMATELKCKIGSVPFIYLGIKVGANMNRISNWDPVVGVIKNRLSKWKASALSIGGRITLIKSVLETLPTYYFSLFKAPLKVFSNIEAIIKRFLWGGSDDVKKLHWVSWEKVTLPKRQGGLGLSRMVWCNQSLLAKWVWRFRSEGQGLWVRVVQAIHSSSRKWESLPSNSRYSSAWNSIVRFEKSCTFNGKRLSSYIKGIIGDGGTVRFWLDIWVGDVALKTQFPALFLLEKDKLCLVKDRVCSNSNTSPGCFNWKWKRRPTAGNEAQQLQDCILLLDQVRLQSPRDSWRWLGDNKGVFSVAGVKKLCLDATLMRSGFIFKWCKWVPSKCNIFAWRAGMDKLPTKIALKRRSIDVGDSSCSFCGEAEESSSHIFTGCQLASEVWQAISVWCKIPPLFAFETSDLLEASKYAIGSRLKKEVLHGLVIITCWRLWKARNEKLFEGRDIKATEIVTEVKALGFLWFSHRHKCKSVDWNMWCIFELL